MRKITAIIIMAMLTISLVSCGNSISTSEPAVQKESAATSEGSAEGPEESAAAVTTASEPAIDYADEAFMESLKIGLQNRWDASKENDDMLKENGGVYPDTQTEKNSYYICIDAELEQISDYTSKQFENTKLQESAIAYINILDDSRKCVDKYLPADNYRFSEEWGKIYNQRSKAIKEFVNVYGLTVDEEYQSTLDEFLSTASYVEEKEDKEEEVQQLVNSIEFELKEDVEGYKTYSAVVENTTDINFEFINLEINLLDADGVIVESTNSNINNFNSGSKARFEFDTMEDFDSYDIVASWAEK